MTRLLIAAVVAAATATATPATAQTAGLGPPRRPDVSRDQLKTRVVSLQVEYARVAKEYGTCGSSEREVVRAYVLLLGAKVDAADTTAERAKLWADYNAMRKRFWRYEVYEEPYQPRGRALAE